MTSWEKFTREKFSKILTEKKSIVDIGGGMRITKDKGNRYDPSRQWMLDLIVKNEIDYKILDPVLDYSPDIVGNIHNLPLADNSQEAIACLAVLEHIEDPHQASREMYRVLEPGGYCYVFVPFLYYYHAEQGYYADYWRFTYDAIKLLFKDFSSIEIEAVRGAIETWFHLAPLGRVGVFVRVARWLDKVLKKNDSRQVSGYSIFLVK